MALNSASRAACFSIIVFSVAVTGSFFDEHEKPWYVALSNLPFPHYYALDVDASNTTLPLQNVAADSFLVEFYAPWCPHCQHFAPEVERLALAAQRLNDGASLAVITVDCVKYFAACDAYGVQGFPTLLWGKRSNWLEGAQARHRKGGISRIMPEHHTAEDVALQLGTHAHLTMDVSRVSAADPWRLSRSHATSAPGHASSASLWDAQVATALLLHNALAQHPYSNESRSTAQDRLRSFLGFLSQRFPDAHCRASLSSLHQRLGTNWARLEATFSDMEASKVQYALRPDMLEKTWKLCGANWAEYAQGWHSCIGSVPGKRGYTCGIWTLFHSVAARTSDDMAFHDLESIRAIVEHFFDCQDCRDHFLKIPLERRSVRTKRDAQLWLWHAHNIVNWRVGRLEAENRDGDPAFPKMQWPGAAECPTCRTAASGSFLRRSSGVERGVFASIEDAIQSEGWNLDQVFAFLDNFYGRPS